MKFKYSLIILLFFVMMSCAAASFMPENGTFAFREVEIFDINGLNFTMPTDFEITYENASEMHFRHDADRLKISVEENGEIKKVKENLSKNITSGDTMFGSVEGYLVDRNGTYTFSYVEDGKLVVIKSRDMSLMIGAMGKD